MLCHEITFIVSWCYMYTVLICFDLIRCTKPSHIQNMQGRGSTRPKKLQVSQGEALHIFPQPGFTVCNSMVISIVKQSPVTMAIAHSAVTYWLWSGANSDWLKPRLTLYVNPVSQHHNEKEKAFWDHKSNINCSFFVFYFYSQQLPCLKKHDPPLKMHTRPACPC